MSVLGFMGKMLENAKVDWKALDDVGEFQRGKRFVKTDMVAQGTPCIHYGEMYTYYGIWAKKAQSFVSGDLAANLRLGRPGDVVIVAAGETIEDIGNGTAWLGKQDVAIHDACFSFRSGLNPKYVSYFLRTSSFKEQIRSEISSGKISSINAKGLGKAKIPIPFPDEPEKSLAIQSEIVRILDSFTELTAELAAELTAELEARNKQYKSYRDQLLTFENAEVERMPMEDIGEFIRGKRFTKADYRDEGISAIHYGEIYTHYGVFANETLSKVKVEMANSLRFAEKNDVIMAGVSETLEDVGKAVAWLGEGKVAIHDDSYAFRHKMNPKYIAYAMQTDAFHSQKGQFVSRGKIKRLLIDGMKKVKLPIPSPSDFQKSLAEQARIVAILDKFDTLTSSLSEELPREIALRQKQYEYYRELLLSFPEPAELTEQ